MHLTVYHKVLFRPNFLIKEPVLLQTQGASPSSSVARDSQAASAEAQMADAGDVGEWLGVDSGGKPQVRHATTAGFGKSSSEHVHHGRSWFYSFGLTQNPRGHQCLLLWTCGELR